MSSILAIDPGNTESGWVLVRDGKIEKFGISKNEELLRLLQERDMMPNVLAIEWVSSYGMPVGKEVFETCLWAGRFLQCSYYEKARLIVRPAIKLHHCNSSRAKDENISQALRDKYGEKGTKKNQGYFYGFKSHMWAAFAVAAYVMEGGTDNRELHF